jgi:TRAP-type C4-dicarboxylate transport system substrate-binding protein
VRLLATICLLFLAACSRPLPEGVTELTYGTPYSPGHPFSRADIRWMKHVEEQSGGTLRIRPVWSGSLLSSDMSMEEIRHGVADLGLITPIYVRGGTHLIRVQSGFYSGVTTVEGQVELYKCLLDSSPQMRKELEGMKVLAVQGGLLPGIVTRDRPVRSLEDLKGLRLRAPTELMRVLDNLGADPINMPMGEVYSALAKGVIDGVVAPIDTFKSLHFGEVANYYNTIAIPRGAYPSRAIGMKRWNTLSPEHKRILEESVKVWEAALAEEVKASAKDGLLAAKEEGVVISPASPKDQAMFDTYYLRDAEKNAADLERLGIDGAAAFKVARASIVGPNQIKCGGPA